MLSVGLAPLELALAGPGLGDRLAIAGLGVGRQLAVRGLGLRRLAIGPRRPLRLVLVLLRRGRAVLRLLRLALALELALLAALLAHAAQAALHDLRDQLVVLH